MKNMYVLPIFFLATLSYAQVDYTAKLRGSFHIDGAKDNSVTGTPSAIQQENDFTVLVDGNVGIGTVLPAAKLDIIGTAATPPLKVTNIGNSYQAANNNINAAVPLSIDKNGVIVKQFSPITLSDGYALDGPFSAPAGTSIDVFTNVYTGSIVTFEFNTNFAFGYSNTGIIYGKITFSVRNGFQVGSDWNFSGNSSTGTVSLTGVGTNTLTFDYNKGPDLIFEYSNGVISVKKTEGGAGLAIFVFNGKKIR